MKVNELTMLYILQHQRIPPWEGLLQGEWSKTREVNREFSEHRLPDVYLGKFVDMEYTNIVKRRKVTVWNTHITTTALISTFANLKPYNVPVLVFIE